MTRVSYIVMYMTASIIPVTDDATDPTPNVRCIHCGKLLGRAHGRILTISNGRAPAIEEIPVGVPSFETKCGACNTVLHIVWQ